MFEKKAFDSILSDVQLADNCKNGEIDDFGIIYDKYVRRIYDFIYFKTHHKETAEDLCSKTFMKCLENIKNYDSLRGTLSSWIYRIATNTVIDHYRTQKITYDINDAWDVASSEDILMDVENKDKFKEVEKFLKTLKAEQRDIVMLRIWSGLSYKEIAEISNKSEDNCKMIFSRAIGKIRKEVLIAFLIMFFGR